MIYILSWKCTSMCDVDSSDHQTYFARKPDENTFSTDGEVWHLVEGNQQGWQSSSCNGGAYEKGEAEKP